MFLAEKKIIKKSKKLVCKHTTQKKLYCAHKSLKTSINTKKVHKVIQFNQEAWLESYINMNTKLRTDRKMILKKISLN